MVMKKNVKLLGMVAMFSVTLASCTNDELKEVYQGEEISFTTRMTRAVETNSGNLKAFRVYAHAENYGSMFINHEMATKSDGNIFSLVSHTGGSFFWPSKVNNIEFWAYGPFTSTTSADSVKVDAEITSLSQQLQNFKVTPSMTEGGKGHKDLIVAYTKANRNTVSGMTVPLNFKHALSQIEVTAKCPDTEKTIKIKGAWLMNVKSSGTLAFSQDKEQDAYMDWHLKNETLIIDFSDCDIYKKTFPVQINQSHKYTVDFNASKMPKWIYGTWQTTDGLEYMNISRDGTNLSIALWSDFGDIPPTQNRSFRKIISVYDIDSFNIKMIVKGYDYSNKIREIVILFDSHAKEVRLIYSRSVEAKRI